MYTSNLGASESFENKKYWFRISLISYLNIKNTKTMNKYVSKCNIKK
jgi:hypothetical protein